jgi:hypothetical protein
MGCAKKLFSMTRGIYSFLGSPTQGHFQPEQTDAARLHCPPANASFGHHKWLAIRRSLAFINIATRLAQSAIFRQKLVLLLAGVLDACLNSGASEQIANTRCAP